MFKNFLRYALRDVHVTPKLVHGARPGRVTRYAEHLVPMRPRRHGAARLSAHTCITRIEDLGSSYASPTLQRGMADGISEVSEMKNATRPHVFISEIYISFMEI